ncbi:TolC family protein [Pedobacter sp. JCM 36344]|uniref:TolC family protein n=1 Tax=Pedobacter sp. JCM 36344 TaxID=3374280 RepID=UPI00397BE853
MNCNPKLVLSLGLVIFACSRPLALFAQQQQSILPEISYLYVEKLIAAARENYPRIKSLTSQVEVAKQDLNAAKISWLDPFSFQYVGRNNQSQSPPVVNVTNTDLLTGYQFGVSFNPGSLLAKPSNVKKAKEQVNVAKYTKEEYLLTLEAEVKRRYFAYLQAQKSLLPFNNALLDAETSFKTTKIAYQKAEVTIEQYNSASTSYYSAYQSKLQAEVAFISAKALLEELTVKKLEEIK